MRQWSHFLRRHGSFRAIRTTRFPDNPHNLVHLLTFVVRRHAMGRAARLQPPMLRMLPRSLFATALGDRVSTVPRAACRTQNDSTGLKPGVDLYLCLFMARLKACPDTKIVNPRVSRIPAPGATTNSMISESRLDSRGRLSLQRQEQNPHSSERIRRRRFRGGRRGGGRPRRWCCSAPGRCAENRRTSPRRGAR
jgi:hypothetical protein